MIDGGSFWHINQLFLLLFRVWQVASSLWAKSLAGEAAVKVWSAEDLCRLCSRQLVSRSMHWTALYCTAWNLKLFNIVDKVMKNLPAVKF